MNKHQGLYNKYTVIDNETNQPIDGPCFVLRPDHDEAAAPALRAYAAATDNTNLKVDILDWVGPAPLELSEYQDRLLTDYVEKVEYSYPEGNKTVLCTLTMKGHGFQITGKAGCVNPADYKKELGEHYALENALTKMDEHLGFYRQLKLAGILPQ